MSTLRLDQEYSWGKPERFGGDRDWRFDLYIREEPSHRYRSPSSLKPLPSKCFLSENVLGIMIQSFTGLIHTIAACCALLTGAVVFVRPKATRFHKACGYWYAASMIVLIVTAFFTYHLTGHFNVLHLAAISSCPPLLVGLRAAITRRPEAEWLVRHYYWMGWSFIGLCAAFVAEMSTRLVMPYIYRHYHLHSMTLFWIVVAVASSLVTALGAYMVRRNRGMVEHFQRPIASKAVLAKQSQI